MVCETFSARLPQLLPHPPQVTYLRGSFSCQRGFRAMVRLAIESRGRSV
jgi:hypothetical protein